LFIKGYRKPNIKDEHLTGMVTNWELDNLPLYCMSLDDYERRLKKLVDPSCEDLITGSQIEEVFKDHYAFKDIIYEGSLVRSLMLNPIFKKDESS